MNQTEFIEEKRKVWAKWERHYGMLFGEDYRRAIEKKSGECVDNELFLKDLDTSIPEFVEPALILFPNRNGVSGPKKVEPEKRRRKHLERRFYLVRFVIDCWERDGRSYIPWPYVTTKWNESHASDQISKAVMKAEYYRAMREKQIFIQVLCRKIWQNMSVFKVFLLRSAKLHNISPIALAEWYLSWLRIVKEIAALDQGAFDQMVEGIKSEGGEK